MIPMLAAVLLAQMPDAPPHRREDHRYRWGNGSHARVRVNGKVVASDGLIRDNRVLVPMRPIFEALGADVMWYPATRKVVAHKGGKMVSLVLGESFAYTPKPVRLDYPPRMIRNRVMVPLRFVSETLGARVGWNQETKTARVEL